MKHKCIVPSVETITVQFNFEFTCIFHSTIWKAKFIKTCIDENLQNLKTADSVLLSLLEN